MTLQINDYQIAEDYKRTCAENYDQLFGPTLTIVVVYTLLRIVATNWDDPYYPGLVGVASQWPAFIVWGLMRLCGFKRHAPKTIWLYCLLWVLKVNLGHRDLLLSWMNHPNKQ